MLTASQGGAGRPLWPNWGRWGRWGRRRVHISILTDPLSPCCANCGPTLLLGTEVSVAQGIEQGLLYIFFFFLSQGEKKVRNKDFVSGNPLPQQPRIQLAPAAAGLGGDLTDPERRGGTGMWGCSASPGGLAGADRVCREPALSQGGWQIAWPLFCLPASMSQPTSRQGCSGLVLFLP